MEIWLSEPVLQSSDFKRRQYIRRIINVIKDRPCVDCCGKFDTHEMSFDHLPEFVKLANINDFVRKRSFKGLLREILKCDVVCLRCHEEREVKRGRQNRSKK